MSDQRLVAWDSAAALEDTGVQNNHRGYNNYVMRRATPSAAQHFYLVPHGSESLVKGFTLPRAQNGHK